MSYILDALKKAEANRAPEGVPGAAAVIGSVVEPGPGGHPPAEAVSGSRRGLIFGLIGTGLAMAMAVALGYQMLGANEQQADSSLSTGQVPLSAAADAGVDASVANAPASRAAEAVRIAEATRLDKLELERQSRAATAAVRIETERQIVEAKRIVAATQALETARIAAAAQAEEMAHLAAQSQVAEAQRIVATAKAAETARRVAANQAAEAQRIAAATRALEGARAAALAQATETARIAAAAKAAESARIAAAEQAARLAADIQVAEVARLAAAAQVAEAARLAAAQAAAVAATTTAVASAPSPIATPAGRVASAIAGATLSSASNDASGVSAAGALGAGGIVGKAIGVISGCRVQIRSSGVEYTVDLDGIVCPTQGEPLEREARLFTTRAVFTRDVRFVPSTAISGAYTAAEVFMPGGRVLNAALVDSGLAWSLTDRYRSAEGAARAAKRGIWQ
jgi:endonuclease YncB( thermonuclease family)